MNKPPLSVPTESRPTTFHDRLADTLCNVAQLLDGWHADGTAWSEWDESVRQQVSQFQGEVELIRKRNIPEASSSLLPVGRQTIAFTCGCFASFWDCQSALACCNKHEAPRQTIDNLLKIYEIQFVYKDGLVEVATCEVCSLPIMRTCQRGTIAGWSEWVHNEPLKPQYQKRKCYDRSTTGSTTPDARPIAGSERFDI